jgi:hypothetical protein
LDGETKSTVEAHLASCSECRAWIETYDLFSEALSDSVERHPSSAAIASFAIEAERLAPADLTRVSTHVRGCDDCSRELEATRGAVAMHQPPRRGFSVTHPAFIAALAAGVLLAALAYPAYLSLYDRSKSWSGPVGYLLLSAGTRGESELHTLKLRPGQPAVSLAVLPDLPATLAAEDVLRFEIRAVDESVVWNADMSVAELEADLVSFEVVFFQIPSRTLPPGEYELRLFDPSAPDEPLLRARFGIEAAG